jgi:hypothetical protein
MFIVPRCGIKDILIDSKIIADKCRILVRRLKGLIFITLSSSLEVKFFLHLFFKLREEDKIG